MKLLYYILFIINFCIVFYYDFSGIEFGTEIKAGLTALLFGFFILALRFITDQSVLRFVKGMGTYGVFINTDEIQDKTDEEVLEVIRKKVKNHGKKKAKDYVKEIKG